MFGRVQREGYFYKQRFTRLSYCNDSEKNGLQKWKCGSDKNLIHDKFIWLIEDGDKRGNYKIGPITDKIASSDKAI